MTGKEHEREFRPRRPLLKSLERIEEVTPVEVETAGRLAVAGDHLEAVLGEYRRHAAGIGHGVVELWEPDRGRRTTGVGILSNNEGNPSRLNGTNRRNERQHECNNADKH